MPTRTTLTLDDDVVAALKREARRTGQPFHVVVNETIRRGLKAPTAKSEPYRVAARPMGLRAGIELDDLEAQLDRLDGAARR
jgi:predicted transcriptional regulator